MKLRENEKESLRRIRELVESTHWRKGTYQATMHGKTQYCLVGLVNSETKSLIFLKSTYNPKKGTKRTRLLEAIRQAIKDVTGYTNYEVEYFNDYPTTKREDILKVIDKALTY